MASNTARPETAARRLVGLLCRCPGDEHEPDSPCAALLAHLAQVEREKTELEAERDRLRTSNHSLAGDRDHWKSEAEKWIPFWKGLAESFNREANAMLRQVREEGEAYPSRMMVRAVAIADEQREAAEADGARLREALQGLVERVGTYDSWDGYTITNDDPALLQAKAALTPRPAPGVSHG